MKTDYASYLKLRQLLDLQESRSDPAEHDELLFIVIHQVYELWFKQVLHELDKIKVDFTGNDLFGALATFKRVRMILKTLVGQLDVLETMTPMSFSAFRDRLDTASGFQSAQFRELEFVLGYKRPEVLRFLDPKWDGYERAARRLEEPSIIDHFYEFLEQRGVELPDSVRSRRGAPAEADESVQRALLRLYEEQPEVTLLLEMMADVDEGLQEWRYRHVKMIERTIGSKRGTGGSPGVEFLKRSLFNPIFPDLWAIRHEM
ncbi:MAG: tryptophan 2,3-dioxygenase [bacterium]|nr:tryptophan 2,3-dioxygenase [bacterium]